MIIERIHIPDRIQSQREPQHLIREVKKTFTYNAVDSESGSQESNQQQDQLQKDLANGNTNNEAQVAFVKKDHTGILNVVA